MADILRLQTDVPEVIAVEFTDGLPVKSNYGGDQIMFSLCDGRKIFLPAFAAKKITASGVRPKEQFEICKRETAQGNRVRRQGAIADGRCSHAGAVFRR